VNAVRADGDCPGSYDNIIANTRILLNSIQFWQMDFVWREGNVAAHQLARMTVKLNLYRVWVASFSGSISATICKDLKSSFNDI
jgi:hypothetical protein